MKLSIIVPVYGVEKYLHKCVDSLLNQGLLRNEYEIILVDDGSPDRCPAICDEYAAKNENIKVVHRQNGGLSAARNSGLDVAVGKYVQFVDSDDYLEPKALETLVMKMEDEKLDVLRFNYQNVNEKYEVFDPYKAGKMFVDYRDEVCGGIEFLNNRLGTACYVWQFMFRRELISNCAFKEGIYLEDVEWTPRVLVKADRVTSTDNVVYNYLIRKGSILHGGDEGKRKKMMDDKLLLIDAMKEQMRVVDDKRWFEGMIGQMVFSIISQVCVEYYERRYEYLSILKKKDVFPLSYYNANPTAKRKLRLANLSPNLLCFVLHLIGKQKNRCHVGSKIRFD